MLWVILALVAVDLMSAAVCIPAWAYITIAVVAAVFALIEGLASDR